MANKVAYYDNDQDYIWWHCEGCGHRHMIPIRHGKHEGAPTPWGFNSNLEKPTITPSVLNRWGKYADPTFEEPIQEPNEMTMDPNFSWSGICHIFITDGMVQFLSDCTHKMAGKTIPLPDIK